MKNPVQNPMVSLFSQDWELLYQFLVKRDWNIVNQISFPKTTFCPKCSHCYPVLDPSWKFCEKCLDYLKQYLIVTKAYGKFGPYWRVMYFFMDQVYLANSYVILELDRNYDEFVVLLDDFIEENGSIFFYHKKADETLTFFCNKVYNLLKLDDENE